MEYVEVIELKSSRVSLSEGFQKVLGVVFCENCGKEFSEKDVHGKCSICQGEEFISGNLAASIAGYLRLNNVGLLKKYYSNRRKNKSAVRMNTKRIMLQLLIMDKLIWAGDKHMEDIINRIMWRKW